MTGLTDDQMRRATTYTDHRGRLVKHTYDEADVVEWLAAARAEVLAKVEASRLNLSHIIHRFDCEWTDECAGPNFNDQRLADQIIAALVADLGGDHG